MKLTKDKILSLLKTVYQKGEKLDLVSNNSVNNIVVFDKEIIIDLEITNPTLQSKNYIKSLIKNAIVSEYKENFGVKILSIGFFTKIDQAVIWRGPMASKALKQMIFDSDWGSLDFLLIDLPPGTGDIHLSIMQSLPISGSIVVSTPQNVALIDARKGVSMFKQKNINVPVLGIIENMAYFTPKELPKNKYYLFGKEGAKNLSIDLKVPYLGEVPLIQSIREAGDIGRPASLQENSIIEKVFNTITKNMISELLLRNKKLPETEVIKIKTMSGCSAIK